MRWQFIVRYTASGRCDRIDVEDHNLHRKRAQMPPPLIIFAAEWLWQLRVRLGRAVKLP